MGLCTCLGLGLTSASGCQNVFICFWVRGPSSSFRLQPHKSHGGNSHFKQYSTICQLVFRLKTSSPLCLRNCGSLSLAAIRCFRQRIVAELILATVEVFSVFASASSSLFCLIYRAVVPFSASSSFFCLLYHAVAPFLISARFASPHFELVLAVWLNRDLAYRASKNK